MKAFWHVEVRYLQPTDLKPCLTPPGHNLPLDPLQLDIDLLRMQTGELGASRSQARCAAIHCTWTQNSACSRLLTFARSCNVAPLHLHICAMLPGLNGCWRSRLSSWLSLSRQDTGGWSRARLHVEYVYIYNMHVLMYIYISIFKCSYVYVYMHSYIISIGDSTTNSNMY